MNKKAIVFAAAALGVLLILFMIDAYWMWKTKSDDSKVKASSLYVDHNNVMENYYLGYNLFGDELYTGNVINEESSSFTVYGYLKNGVKDSTWYRINDENGDTVQITNYKDGKKHGVKKQSKRHYRSPELIHFKNGKKDGLYKKWLEVEEMDTSLLVIRSYYDNGNRNGKYERYAYYKSDTLERKIKEKGRFSDGVKNGKWIENEFHEDNFIFDANKINPAAGKGLVKSGLYNYKEGVKNGKAKITNIVGGYTSKGKFSSGKKEGRWIIKHRKRAIEVGEFQNGEKEGVWKRFLDSGGAGEETFSPEGSDWVYRLSSITKYSNGVKDEVFRHYDIKTISNIKEIFKSEFLVKGTKTIIKEDGDLSGNMFTSGIARVENFTQPKKVKVLPKAAKERDPHFDPSLSGHFSDSKKIASMDEEKCDLILEGSALADMFGHDAYRILVKDLDLNGSEVEKTHVKWVDDVMAENLDAIVLEDDVTVEGAGFEENVTFQFFHTEEKKDLYGIKLIVDRFNDALVIHMGDEERILKE